MSFFSVDTIAFTWLGYPMSWLELVGTIFNIWCVWLAARKKILTWPVGLVGIICYLFLFYQIQLYSDLLEQVYFFIMTFVGWWIWYKKPVMERTFVKTLSAKARLIWLGMIIIGSFGLSYLTTHFSQWWPNIFPVAASYALIDATTTVISFVATYLMAKRYFEAWPLWILVDVVGIWLYYVKDVKFIALEYILFLIMAIMGAIDWYRNYKRQTV